MMVGGTENTWKTILSLATANKFHDWKILFNLMSLDEEVIHLDEQGKQTDVVFLDFRKAFDTVPHIILLDRMSCTRLDRNTVWWVSIWPMDGAQRLIVKVFHQVGGWSQAGFPRGPFADHFSLMYSSKTCIQEQKVFWGSFLMILNWEVLFPPLKVERSCREMWTS